MDTSVVAVFAVVYLGMILGGLPFLQLDRTGVALLGAIAIVALGALTPEEAALSIHLPTLLLLFSFMVISAQMRLGGFYTRVTLQVAELRLSPPALLAAMIAVVGTLSAMFSNDVICLAIAPVLADACLARRLDPVPYLLGLACAANVGSAATLIGNPQNMLIGQVLELSFPGYFLRGRRARAARSRRHLGRDRLADARPLAHRSGRPAARAAPGHSPSTTAGSPRRASRWPARCSPCSCSPTCRGKSRRSPARGCC